ncbi:phage portal protein [Burkholderia sp. LAS2]|uniref:phage portal protein n=1 Tax=Burkholderia sp. LAS2 TaxID=2813843 RepID=UPI001BCDB6D6|nr:phage portal protein [Burkholderia sp. LAS2]QVN14819.1 phage portal protein [Burkholderia sp. LAS2]
MTNATNGAPHANASGSRILNQWNAERQAAKVNAAAVSTSQIVPGTDAYDWMTGLQTPGRAVSERGAMSVATVYSCVALIGGAVASTPLVEYERGPNGVLPVESEYWELLNEELHPRWPAAVGWEFGMTGLLLHGDLFSRIHRVTRWSSRIESVEPLHPLSVWVDLVDGRLVYTYLDPATNVVMTVDQDDMIHVPGPGFDGRRGLSQIRSVLRMPVNVASSAGQLVDTMLSDNLRPDLVIKSEGKLTEDQVALLRKQWIQRYSGLHNSSAPVVLGGGMDIKQISMSAADVKLIENRKLTDDDVCSVFGVMPHMVGRSDKGTTIGTTAEQLAKHFVKYTLGRHLTKIAQEVGRKVVRKPKRSIQHDADALDLGDMKSRFEAFRIALGRAGEPGWMSQNDVRRRFNMPPEPDGNKLNSGTKDATKPNPPASE